MAQDEKAPPAPVEAPKPAGDDAKAETDAFEALDLARGDVTDDDLEALEQALDLIDFAARRATPERLETLKALSSRLADLCAQVEQGIRKRAQDRPPLSPEEERRYDALVSQGIAYGEKGELDLAREKLETAVLLDPDEPSGLFNLGVVYGRLAEAATQKGNFYASHVPDEVYAEKAVFCYERVLELEPGNAHALTNAAAIYDLRGETEAARDALTKALAVDPGNAKAREHLADLESSS